MYSSTEESEFSKVIHEISNKDDLASKLGFMPTEQQAIAIVTANSTLTQSHILEMLTHKIEGLRYKFHDKIAQISKVELPAHKILSDASGKQQFERTRTHMAEITAKISSGEYDLKYLEAYYTHHKVLAMFAQTEIEKQNPTLLLYIEIQTHFNSIASSISI